MGEVIKQLIKELQKLRVDLTNEEKKLISGGFVDRTEYFNSMIDSIDIQIIDLIELTNILK